MLLVGGARRGLTTSVRIRGCVRKCERICVCVCVDNGNCHPRPPLSLRGYSGLHQPRFPRPRPEPDPILPLWLRRGLCLCLCLQVRLGLGLGLGLGLSLWPVSGSVTGSSFAATKTSSLNAGSDWKDRWACVSQVYAWDHRHCVPLLLSDRRK